MTTPNLDALGHRWVSALANFQMSIEYVQGADNKVTDALSHVKDWLSPEAVKELIDFAQNNTPVERAEVDNPTLIAEEEALDHEVVIQSRVLMAKRQVPKQVSTEYWIKLQKRDAIISHVRGWMLRSYANKRTLSQYLLGKVPDDIRQAYACRQQDLVMSHNLLYMKAAAHNARDVTLAFVVPAIKRRAAIDGCHRDSGHQGRAHTLSLLRERFWWPRMQVETTMAIKNCGQCRLFEGQDQQPELYTVEASEPLDLVHIDFVSMETTVPAMKKPIVQKVLVVIDHFTRYVQAYPVDNEQAETVADTLYNKYFCTFGFPRWLMSNQAQAFVGKVLGKLCQQLQVEKVRTSPYHPQSNGQVERVHQTLMRMIGKLDTLKKKRWPEHIASICHAYNTTRSQVTGYSPYFLMFGRRPRIPIDLLFPTARRAEVEGLDNYVTALYEHLKEAVSKAKLMADKEAHRYKRVYDRRAGAVELTQR